MTVYEFAFMDELTQLETFWDGKLIGEQRHGEFVMMCRQVDDFYVEYKTLGGHYIALNVFTNASRLNLYLV